MAERRAKTQQPVLPRILSETEPVVPQVDSLRTDGSTCSLPAKKQRNQKVASSGLLNYRLLFQRLTVLDLGRFLPRAEASLVESLMVAFPFRTMQFLFWPRKSEHENKKSSGGAGYRSRYLSHAKRALYHLSYAPSLASCPDNLLDDFQVENRVDKFSRTY